MGSKKTQLVETELSGGCQGWRVGGNREMLVRKYRFPVVRWTCSGVLMCRVVIIINNIVS